MAFKEIHHPGIKPRNTLRNRLQQSEERITRTISDGIKAAIAKYGSAYSELHADLSNRYGS